MRAVLDATGADRPVLFGEGPDGGGSCAMFAATYPERVLALVWWSAHARSLVAPDYPWGDDEMTLLDERASLERAWGSDEAGAELLRITRCPSLQDDPAAQRWIAKFLRYGATPAGARAFHAWYTSIDVRDILPAIRVPALIVQDAEPEALYEARFIAAHIPGARAAPRSGEDFPPWLGDMAGNVAMVESFIASVRHEEAELDRMLATVLFTDIVGSTDKARELGDHAWSALLERHHQVVRAMLARYRGVEVDTAGDGFLATFDGPARAVKCAQAIRDAVKPLGLEVRAGCHTGEIELVGEGVAGVAVHIGARVAALAGPSEVLVSSTVKDLVAGSGLAFEDRGAHALKGVPEKWRLYAVVG
jgi:class 3 adenylate cyclase